jgi:hypothetical protein
LFQLVRFQFVPCYVPSCEVASSSKLSGCNLSRCWEWCWPGSRLQDLDLSQSCVSCSNGPCNSNVGVIFPGGLSQEETRSLSLRLQGKGFLFVTSTLIPEGCIDIAFGLCPTSISWKVVVRSLNGPSVSKVVSQVVDAEDAEQEISFGWAIPSGTSLVALDFFFQVRTVLA